MALARGRPSWFYHPNRTRWYGALNFQEFGDIPFVGTWNLGIGIKLGTLAALPVEVEVFDTLAQEISPTVNPREYF